MMTGPDVFKRRARLMFIGSEEPTEIGFMHEEDDEFQCLGVDGCEFVVSCNEDGAAHIEYEFDDGALPSADLAADGTA